ncbi:hypothetical protein KAU88_06670 [Candidatus Bathyarchaeota archaeon]|nr:hypothetical protein [Candidatus Bathyarchaeota archaeon]
MIRNYESLVNKLANIKSYVEFHPCMLPKGVSRYELINFFEFLSPIMLILHGSTISSAKFSMKKSSDLDIVCVSSKAAFWPLEQLYKRVKENLENEDIKIDVSIITYNELISIIEGESSLSTSFRHGFSLLYQKGRG